MSATNRFYDRLPKLLRKLVRARDLPRANLWFEVVTIFVVFPLGLYVIRHHFGPWLMQVLVVTAVGTLAVLSLDPDFDRRRLGWPIDRRALVSTLKRVALVFVPGALLLTAWVLWAQPELFLRFPRQQPRLYVAVMLLYPLFSVYPQELLFRTFFFHRYRSILDTGQLIAASSLSFGLAHIFFGNWIAPTLTAIGGWLFARTYARTESTLLCSLEHGLWGDFLFTVGLGWYFYSGSIT